MLLRSPRRFRLPTRTARLALASALLAGVAGCGNVVLTDGGSLSRRDQFVASDAVASESKLFIDPTLPQTVRTVRIVPTRFTAAVSGPGLTEVERRVIANAADRALCYDLSLRYDVVSSGKADLTVRSAITRVDVTNVPASSATVAATTAISSFTNQARFSAAGDAYDLAGEFGQDFGSYLATGKDPFKGELQLPTYDRIRITTLGEAPLDPDCEAFGRAPGFDGILGDMIGLPPEWTDKGPGVSAAR